MNGKKILAALCAAALALPLIACGGSSSSSKSASGGAVKLVDIDLTDEEYAFGVDKDNADLLKQLNDYIAKIKDDGTFDDICNHYFADGKPVEVESAAEDSSKDQLVVATNAEFEPFEYMAGDKYTGIDMEIAKGFADEIVKELVIKNMDFDSVCLSINQKKADVAMAGLTVTEDRKEYVTFSDPYYEASQKLIVKSDDTTFDDCKSKEDVEKILQGLDDKTTIGGQEGTTAGSYVQGSEDMGFDGLSCKWSGYSSPALAVQDMINGNIDYVMTDAAPAAAVVKKINATN